MRPLSALLLFTVTIFWVVVTFLKFPSLVLGLFLSPILTRFYWVVEFWYPTAIGKWLHLLAIRLSKHTGSASSENGDINKGFHSRSTETRAEIIPGRVFVHPLPQFLDNLGYLVVCVPRNSLTAASKTIEASSLATIHIDPQANDEEARIVAFVVDCGDADAVAKHVKLIRSTFYNNQVIHVQSVLSTHKHHDHTAGNHAILKHPDFVKTIPVKLIFGGAVDKVPACNYPLKNGDKLPLPRAGENDMNDLIEVEAVATPAHTRGSMAYILRPLPGLAHDAAACLFTGDTVFSAGGGVPFEADIDPGQDEKVQKMTANSYIKASSSTNAMERCFAEVLYRCIPVGTDTSATASTDRLLVFPGHEYTNELLTRQLISMQENCRWKNFAPSSFFQTVSQFYVALHRRSLPISSGKLMTVPSTVSRELYINPHLRSLKQRGVLVLTAIRQWNRSFAKEKVSEMHGPAFAGALDGRVTTSEETTRSSESQWNLNAADVNRPVFATVYAADLDKIIQDLRAGTIDTETAVIRLGELKTALDKPVIGRRPIPGTLPSTRAVYRGLLGLALLGSSPTAMTHSDSLAMKLPAPIVTSSDSIRVSKKRLLAVLYWLGLLNGDDGNMLVSIIQQLWKETKEYSTKLDEAPTKSSTADDDDLQLGEDMQNYSTDVESLPEADDEVELGALKWIIYGIPAQQPKSWLSSLYCMPCGKSATGDDLPSKDHPAGKSGMNRHGGELVRHDVFTCPLCVSATGHCPKSVELVADELVEEKVNGYSHQISSSSPLHYMAAEDSPEDESSAFIEISPQSLSFIG